MQWTWGFDLATFVSARSCATCDCQSCLVLRHYLHYPQLKLRTFVTHIHIPSHPIPFHSQHVARSMLMSRADLRIAMLCFCVIRCGAPPTDPHETRTMSVKPSAGGIPVAHDWYDLVAFVVTYFLIWFIFQDYLYHVLRPVGDVRVLRWGDGVHFIFGLVQMLVAFGVPWICFGAHLVSEQQGLTWEAHCFYLLVEGLALPWQVIAPLKTEALNTGRPSVRTQISAWRVPPSGIHRCGSRVLCLQLAAAMVRGAIFGQCQCSPRLLLGLSTQTVDAGYAFDFICSAISGSMDSWR